MSIATPETLDVGQALLAEQQRYVQLIEQGASRADVSHGVLLDIHGPVQVQRLHQALDSLAARHPLLSSGFVAVAGYRGLRQVQGSLSQGIGLSEHTGIAPLTLREQRAQAWAQRPASLQDVALDGLLQRLDDQHWQLRLSLAAYVGDASSLNLLVQELFVAYQQGDVAANEDPGQFSQYLDWRAEVLLDEDADTARNYWQQQVLVDGAVPAAAQLPYRCADRSALGTQTLSATVEPALSASLSQLAQKQGTSLAHLLQAAWWVLLARISGREVFSAGWRHDARHDYEFFAESPGLFEKTLPLVIDVAPERSFSHCLSQLSSTLEQHGTWQEYWSAQAYPPLLTQALGFACRSAWQAREQGGLAWTAQRLAHGDSSFELLLNAELDQRGEARQLSLDYAGQHYSSMAAQVLLDQYKTLLRSVIADADAPVGQLNLLSEAERGRLLAFAAAGGVSDNVLLAQRVADWARSTPDALALVDAEQSLSYAELERRTAALASQLAQLGVAAGAVVGLALPRSASLLVAMLATWRVGAAYVPIDPQWPVARQMQVLRQAGAALLLADDRSLPTGANAAVQVVGVEQAMAQGSALDPIDAWPNQGSDVAYLLFTSGSTGVPKGVVIEHRHLLNYVAAASHTLGLQACRHMAFSSTVAADLGNTTLFGALFNGATLHVADDQTMQDPLAFAGFVREHGIDCIKIVPSHLGALLDAQHPQVPGTVILGGEAPAPALLQRIRQLDPQVRLFNHYGPTETTVGVLVHELAAQSMDAVPLTQVLPGNQVYLLDERLQLVAPGELGELYIGGAQVCRGYLNAGAEAFVDSPFDAGERLYRSGDLGRYRLQGGVQLHGRRDDQVKVRGFRIELGEIEQQLLSLPAVSEAVVLAHETGELQAFVVARQAVPAQWLGELKAALALRLPAAMQPRSIQQLPAMPRLANGKPDRQALRQYQVAEVVEDYVAPRDAIESLLATRMALLLDVPRLSVTQDFFAAGGHSLLVIKLVAGIRKLLQCEIHPGVVFDHPSPAALAQVLRSQEGMPGQLQKLAAARLRLDAMSPEQKAALLDQARGQ